jgi:hypothetical protein
MRAASFLAAVTLAVIGAGASGACVTVEPQTTTYFDQTIDPILQSSCVRTNTGAGCHVADSHGNAFGNLDLTSYAGVNARRDLLLDYGPYLQPSMLVKNVPPYAGRGAALGRHADHRDHRHQARRWPDPRPHGERVSDAAPLDRERRHRWTTRAIAPVDFRLAPLHDTIPGAPGFDPNTDPTHGLGAFQSTGRDSWRQTCAAGNCHGTTRQRALSHLRQHASEVRWNYFAASQLPLGHAGAERDRPAPARHRAGRELPRRRPALLVRAGPELPGAPAVGASARRAARHGPRPGVPVLRAEGAAHPREEGLHDGRSATRRRCSTTIACAAARRAASP